MSAFRSAGNSRRRWPSGVANYDAALTLAGTIHMRPLQARCHLGLGRHHVRSGRHETAGVHLTIAMKLFFAMDMPFWVKQTVAAMNELGRLLVVARASHDLYDYLTRVLSPDELVRVILDRRVEGDSAVAINRRRSAQADTLLKSHGLAVVNGADSRL